MTSTGSTSTLTAADTAPAGGRLIQRLGTDTRYVLLGFPLAVASFATLVTGFALGVGLLPVTLGVLVLAVTLLAARGFADTERLQLRQRDGDRPVRPAYPAPAATRNPYRKSARHLTHAQSWLDLLHGLVIFVVSTFAFVVTVSWWAGAAGGLSYWLWERFLPEGGNDIVVTAVLGTYSHTGEITLFTVAGGVMLLTLPAVVRAMAGLRAGLARTLLVDLPAYRG